MTPQQEEEERLKLEALALLLTVPALAIIDGAYNKQLSQDELDRAIKLLTDARLFGYDFVRDNAANSKLGKVVYNGNDAKAWAVESVGFMQNSTINIVTSVVESYEDTLTSAELQTAIANTLTSRRQNRGESYANTAVNGAVETAKFALISLMIGQKKEYKTWRTVGDSKVRNTHRAANGQKVEIYDDFKVGDSQMMYPRDKSADIKETANCRCMTVFSTKWSK